MKFVWYKQKYPLVAWDMISSVVIIIINTQQLRRQSINNTQGKMQKCTQVIKSGKK